MDLGVISVRYARALFKSALELKVEDKVYGEMQSLAQSFIDVPQLRLTLDNPMLSKDKKQQLVETACGQNISELTQKFIQLVLKEDREKALQFMSTSYISLYRKQKNIVSGKLVTACKVSEKIEEKMKKMVESRTQGTVELSSEINPDIIGGFVLEYDTYRIDASVKSQLQRMLVALKQ